MPDVALVQIARSLVAGGATLGQLVAQRRVRREHWWLAARGAGRYVLALSRGDVAPDEIVAIRRGECAVCPFRTSCAGAEYCGPALEESPPEAAGDVRTCGCLIPAKTAVASEECPQGRWRACQPPPVGSFP
jgi:hypothetical protein